MVVVVAKLLWSTIAKPKCGPLHTCFWDLKLLQLHSVQETKRNDINGEACEKCGGADLAPIVEWLSEKFRETAEGLTVGK